jgi:hypothetical protein
MRKGILSTVAALLAASAAWAEPPTNSCPAPAAGNAAPGCCAAGCCAAGCCAPGCCPANCCPANGPACCPSPCAAGCTPCGPSCPAQACCSPCCEPAPDCGCCNERGWVSADYLLWWIRNTRLPPLFTVGSPADAIPGAIGQPHTAVLSPASVDNHDRTSARFGAGYWLNDCHTYGFEVGAFFLASRDVHFGADSGPDGRPLIALPFLTPPPASREAALPASFPDVLRGGVSATLANRLWGYEANGRGQVLSGEGYCVSAIAGFRYLELSESLTLNSSSTLINPGLGSIFTSASITDRFGDRNYFYGGQAGVDATVCAGPVRVELLAKVALGCTQEVAVINGTTTAQRVGDGPATFPSGLFAQTTNGGRHSNSEFAVVPEGAINVGYNIRRNITATVGYTFLYISDVYRPGQLIDRTLNLSQIPHGIDSGTSALVGPARPAFPGRDTEFWAQGISFGLQFRY